MVFDVDICYDSWYLGWCIGNDKWIWWSDDLIVIDC